MMSKELIINGIIICLVQKDVAMNIELNYMAYLNLK